MKVRMLVDRLASIDGIHVQEYKAGEAYDLPGHLSDPWLEQGVCEQDKMDAGPSETKNEKPRMKARKPR
jgi:hypothetical protein